MKTKVACLLLLGGVSLSAHASYDVSVLKQQRQKIDSQIAERNKIVDGLKVKLSDNDISLLNSINASELTIEYSVQIVEDFLLSANNSSGVKSKKEFDGVVSDMKFSVASICELQVSSIEADSYSIENSDIKKSIERQIENSRTACDLAKGLIVKDGKSSLLY